MTTEQFKFGTWYPIEFASKDGTEYLLTGLDLECRWYEIGFWGCSHADSDTWIEGRDLAQLDPTHFMPLVPPSLREKTNE